MVLVTGELLRAEPDLTQIKCYRGWEVDEASADKLAGASHYQVGIDSVVAMVPSLSGYIRTMNTARVVNMNSKDPFLILLRREIGTHFVACVIAFLVLVASRYVGLRVASSDAVLLSPSAVGFIADFATAVLILTFFRVLYGIPLWFARPAIRRVGAYVLFTLAFGVLFTMRTQQAIGARVEQGGVRLYYPYPTASLFVPVGELSQPRLRETSLVSIVEFPDTSYHFVPTFRFDATGQARLRLLFHALTTVTNRVA